MLNDKINDKKKVNKVLNKEKYAKEIIDIAITGDDIALKDNIPIKCSKTLCNGCERNSSIDCCSEKKLFEWANSEYKESVLTDEEREYLSSVIRPFRDKVKCILKCSNSREWIEIRIINNAKINFPYFEKCSMYKGMELDREYTLEELEL